MDIGQDIFETKTDPGATEWRIHDDVVRLREWGTEIIHRLPQAPWDSAVIGTAESCSRVQLIVCAESRQHTKPYHIEPIVIPPLSSRPQEIPRIIDEYADEAAAAVCADSAPSLGSPAGPRRRSRHLDPPTLGQRASADPARQRDRRHAEGPRGRGRVVVVVADRQQPAGALLDLRDRRR